MDITKKNMSCEELLSYAEEVNSQKFKHVFELRKQKKEMDDEIRSAYDKAEIEVYELAIDAAKTTEELDKCIEEIEVNFVDEDWINEMKIKAYGPEKFLKDTLSSPAFQEFAYFLKDNSELLEKNYVS